MGATEQENRRVHVSFDVSPQNVETDEDLTNIGRFVMEIARDEMLKEDDPVAWREQKEAEWAKLKGSE